MKLTAILAGCVSVVLSACPTFAGGPDGIRDGSTAAKLGTALYNSTIGKDDPLPMSPTFDAGGKQLWDMTHPKPAPSPSPLNKLLDEQGSELPLMTPTDERSAGYRELPQDYVGYGQSSGSPPRITTPGTGNNNPLTQLFEDASGTGASPSSSEEGPLSSLINQQIGQEVAAQNAARSAAIQRQKKAVQAASALQQAAAAQQQAAQQQATQATSAQEVVQGTVVPSKHAAEDSDDENNNSADVLSGILGAVIGARSHVRMPIPVPSVNTRGGSGLGANYCATMSQIAPVPSTYTNMDCLKWLAHH